jgi:hypothetical protein
MIGYVLAVLFFAVAAALARLGAIQKGNMSEWLVYAVTEAERDLGGGTGQLKLRYVYDLFSNKFSVLSRLLSFGTFSAWVDIALVEMKRLLANGRVREYVEGGGGNG